MRFRKNIPRHQWRDSKISMTGNRFVFLSFSNAAEKLSELDQVEDEIEVLEKKLKGPLAIEKRQQMEKELAILKDRRKQLTLLEPENAPTIGMNVIQNAIESKKSEVKKGALEAFEAIKRPIKSETELEHSLKDWDLDNRRLSGLDGPELSYLQFNDLMGSELGLFFDDETIAKMSEAKDKMKRADYAMQIAQPVVRSELLDAASIEWDKSRKTELEKAYKMAMKSGNKEMAKLIQEEQGEDSKKDWVFKRAMELEKSKIIKLRDRVPEAVIEKAKAVVLEAREHRKNAVIEYLQKKHETSIKKIKKIAERKPPRISQKQLDNINKFMQHLQGQLENPASLARKLEVAKQLAENMDRVAEETEAVEKEVEEYGSDPEKFVSNIRSQYKRYEYIVSCFAPERIDQLQAQLDEEEHKRIEAVDPKDRTKYDYFGKSAIYQKKRKMLEELKSSDSPFRKQKEEFNKRMEKLEEMTPEELLRIQRELDEILNKVGMFDVGKKIDDTLHPENLSEANKAREVIKRLEGVSGLEEIKSIVHDPELGFKENIVFVPDEKGNTFTAYFDEDGNKYDLSERTGGNMVFFKRGEQWKIIINEEAFKDPEQASRMNGLIAHELLHLEFENNTTLQKKWVDLYTSSENWEEIQDSFVAAYPTKRPPYTPKKPDVKPKHINKLYDLFPEIKKKEWAEVTEDEWKNEYWPAICKAVAEKKLTFLKEYWNPEDIVNELYALQNDIGSILRPDDESAFNKLRTAILTSGVAQKALGTPNVRIYGAEDDAGDVSQMMSQAGASPTAKEEGGGESAEAGSAGQYEKQIEELDKKLKSLLNSEYLSYLPGASGLVKAMDDYNNETADLNKLFGETGSNVLDGTIKERIGQVKKDIGEIEGEIQKVADNIPNQHINPLRALWNDTTILSLSDILQVGTDIKEWMDRRHKRRQADHAARIGAALFDKMPIPVMSEFGTEADARQQKAEADEVNEWKSRLENKDAWELIDLMKKMADQVDPNKDALKAILRILSEKGRIDWREPALWKLLNKLQSKTYLDPNDEMLLSNPVLLQQKLHAACGEIWDYDEYLSLKNKNESTYESRKKEYMESIHHIQRSIDKRLEQLYLKDIAGENVDPMEFEALLEYSIVYGKCYSEAVMFYLIAGTARGLLTPDRSMVLDKYLNEFPTIEYVTEDYAPKSKKGAFEICKDNFFDEYKKGVPGKNFKNFYWTVIQNSQNVLERVRKSAPERKWDHDWSRGIAAMCDGNSMKVFLSGRSGEVTQKTTAMENMYVGMLQWMEENSINPESRDWKKGYYRAISAFCMAEGIRKNVAYREDVKFQRGEGILGNMAREGPVTNHGDWNVGRHIDKMQNFVGNMGGISEFFALITNSEAASAADPDNKGKAEAHLNTIQAFLTRYPAVSGLANSFQSLNDVFNNMDVIVTAILDQVDDASFLAAIKSQLPA